MDAADPCPEADDPGRKFLGDEQKKWFKGGPRIVGEVEALGQRGDGDERRRSGRTGGDPRFLGRLRAERKEILERFSAKGWRTWPCSPATSTRSSPAT